MNKLVNNDRKDGNWTTNGTQYVSTTIKGALMATAKSIFQADKVSVDMTKERDGKTIFAASLYKTDVTGTDVKFKGIIGNATSFSNTKNTGGAVSTVYEHTLSIEWSEG